MTGLILNILLLVQSADGARRLAADQPTMTVSSGGSSAFLKAKYPDQKIEVVDENAVARDEATDGYLGPHARAAVIEKVGLTAPLAKYDELDKDMLIMAVRDADQDEMNRLLKGYPNLNLDQLKRLKAALGGTK